MLSVRILMDSAKMFDSLDKAILLRKLEKSSLKWFMNLFYDGLQYVCCVSMPPVKFGVPQVSIIGQVPMVYKIHE